MIHLAIEKSRTAINGDKASPMKGANLPSVSIAKHTTAGTVAGFKGVANGIFKRDV